MAEKLAFKQGMGNRRAIQRYKSPCRRGRVLWIAWAITSLPVSHSPPIRTVQSIGASSFNSFSAAMNCGLDPIKPEIDIVPLPAPNAFVRCSIVVQRSKRLLRSVVTGAAGPSHRYP